METFQLAGGAPAAYERHLVPRLFEPLADRLVDLASPAGAERVLDVACGTGVVARRAASTGAAVTGVDVNPGMVDLARDLGPALDWQVGSAESLAVPADTFDVVYCQQGLQFISDRPAALQAMVRALRPGGRLALVQWRPIGQSPGFAALVAALDSHAGPAAGDVLRSPFALGEHAPVLAEVVATGFTQARTVNHCHAVHFGSAADLVTAEIEATPLAQLAATWKPEVIDLVVRDTAAALRTYTADDGLLFPMGAYFITAIKP